MKRIRFSVEQIVAVLRQAEMGAPAADFICHLGIAEQTFYQGKRRYAGLESEQVRRFKPPPHAATPMVPLRNKK